MMKNPILLVAALSTFAVTPALANTNANPNNPPVTNVATPVSNYTQPCAANNPCAAANPNASMSYCNPCQVGS
jgi:hypothetical protein